MDGMIVIDKPIGPTSHDVVARVRRVLQERRIGHTGTLDPIASGVLPLVVGRGTRLARFFDHDRKQYDALVYLGRSTDTYDAHGATVGPLNEGPLPAREAIDRALDAFRGTFTQQPPAYSAKKIDGRRSHELAREHAREGSDAELTLPPPVSVTAHSIDLVNVRDNLVALRIACSTGFYVRSLANDLGVALGTGGHLVALRRTEAGGMTLASAVSLAAIEDGPAGLGLAKESFVPLRGMLPGMPAITLTEEGARRAAHGVAIGADLVTDNLLGLPVGAKWARLLDPSGELVAVSERRDEPGLLHPVVVLV